MSLLLMCNKQDFLKIKLYSYNFGWFYVRLSRFFCYPDPDPRFLKWIWIQIRPNDTNPDPKHCLNSWIVKQLKKWTNEQYHILLSRSGSTFPEVDPDPAKWYGSYRILIRNTGWTVEQIFSSVHIHLFICSSVHLFILAI